MFLFWIILGEFWDHVGTTRGACGGHVAPTLFHNYFAWSPHGPKMVSRWSSHGPLAVPQLNVSFTHSFCPTLSTFFLHSLTLSSTQRGETGHLYYYIVKCLYQFKRSTLFTFFLQIFFRFFYILSLLFLLFPSTYFLSHSLSSFILFLFLFFYPTIALLLWALLS